jgi:hypothetical protein
MMVRHLGSSPLGRLRPAVEPIIINKAPQERDLFFLMSPSPKLGLQHITLKARRRLNKFEREVGWLMAVFTHFTSNFSTWLRICM